MENTLAPWRTALVAAAVIAAINLVVLGVGHLAGADLRVTQTVGSTATEVGVGSVLLMSTAPTILGGLTLRLAARRGVRAARAIGWLGLAVGVLTIPLPFTVHATTGTSATLASMHVVAGLVWLTVVHRAAARQPERSVVEVFDHA